MSWSSRVAIVGAICLVVSIDARAENCPQDDTGLTTSSSSDNIEVDNARNAEDFRNGAMNYFFRSAEGYFDFINTIGGNDMQATLLAENFGPGTTSHSFIACSEIGQCAQVSIDIHYQWVPDDGLLAQALEAASLGYLPEYVNSEPTEITISADAPDGSSISTRYSDSELKEVIVAGPMPIVSEGTEAAEDDRCRNNEGDLLSPEDEGLPGGADPGGDEPTIPPPSGDGWVWTIVGHDCEPWAEGNETGITCTPIWGWVLISDTILDP